jgi:hypothetical protein
MSAPDATTVPSPSHGPSLRTRIFAIAVVVALAALAAFTLFSGPTKVPIRVPSSEHARVAPPSDERGTENEGASRGD